MAIRDYIPMHIYNSASGHLFGPEELKGSPTGPQLRPEYATLRAYAAGNIEVLLRCLSCCAGASCRSLRQHTCHRQDTGGSKFCSALIDGSGLLMALQHHRDELQPGLAVLIADSQQAR